jgi:hypothetical protein
MVQWFTSWVVASKKLNKNKTKTYANRRLPGKEMF